MPLTFQNRASALCAKLDAIGTPRANGDRRERAIWCRWAVDDLASVFDRVRLTIAPLAFGAGVKGKVLSSLAAGVPCVCTPVAAEGLDLPPSLQDLVASQPEDLASLIIRLHEDEDFNARCSRAGLDYIAVQASEQAVDTALRRVVQPSHAAGTRLVGGLAATADVASP